MDRKKVSLVFPKTDEGKPKRVIAKEPGQHGKEAMGEGADINEATEAAYANLEKIVSES